MARILRLSTDTFEEAVESAIAVLLRGGIVALPTDTLYGVSTLIDHSHRLYALKERPQAKPLGLFLPSADSIPLIANMTISPELAHRLLPGPVTLVFNRSPLLPDNFNPDVASVGVRVPDSSIVVAICSRLGVPLAQTSANLSGSTLNPTAVEDFNDLLPHIDLVLDGGRIPSASREGSTVVDLTKEGRYHIVRDGFARKATEDTLRDAGLVAD
ncbi:hypothetical protein WR25_11038 [Diploscapter pachys]|uniref:Threonylcarbamoyl-AMP synthase n=1 Tax=Diploscapter pachys TaxID=2018661 RepID=A0A2A2LTT7_9BILA|nr:hypothetical protein WR25_11038 [Diploscapter pachys]